MLELFKVAAVVVDVLAVVFRVGELLAPNDEFGLDKEVSDELDGLVCSEAWASIESICFVTFDWSAPDASGVT